MPPYNATMKDDTQRSKPPAQVENRRARHDYSIEERYEAGLVLEGWEVKALRAGRIQIRDSYALIKNGAIWLIGSQIAPLPTVSTHRTVDPERTRKLLLHQREIDTLRGAVERRGLTLIPLRLYWKHGRAKLELGLARGKKLHDKRRSERERDWARQKARLLRHERPSS